MVRSCRSDCAPRSRPSPRQRHCGAMWRHGLAVRRLQGRVRRVAAALPRIPSRREPPRTRSGARSCYSALVARRNEDASGVVACGVTPHHSRCITWWAISAATPAPARPLEVITRTYGSHSAAPAVVGSAKRSATQPTTAPPLPLPRAKAHPHQREPAVAGSVPRSAAATVGVVGDVVGAAALRRAHGEQRIAIDVTRACFRRRRSTSAACDAARRGARTSPPPAACAARPAALQHAASFRRRARPHSPSPPHRRLTAAAAAAGAG